ncbi:IS3 family transposase [Sedimentimonas flavescens]|uniref:IS3 family transposase n=1 Tax=Sedimentimonas flavescens TaxID=2851012 RepID=UPI0039A5320B
MRQVRADRRKVYGDRKLAGDLRDQGERVSENRVARLAPLARIAAYIGYRRHPGRYCGKSAVVSENRLKQDKADLVSVRALIFNAFEAHLAALR